jgi:hypothetical protein
MLTLPEFSEKLEREEETILLEILNIESHEIVERFQDKVEERYENLREEYEETEDLETE